MTDIYNEDNIKSLDWHEHIRIRPGMYIGKLGDGSEFDDGIYILLKEVIDNSIDEFIMGVGKEIDITLTNDTTIKVRDYGRGIPLGKLIDCVSKINTGGKYDSKAFKKSAGLNGVGTKAVNSLSINFEAISYRDGKVKKATFSKGELVKDYKITKTTEKNGTEIIFTPDNTIFKDFKFNRELIIERIKYYTYLNAGLKIIFDNEVYQSENGLKDLLKRNVSENSEYPIIHLITEDLEIAFTHGNHYGEEYFSFVNGQNTIQGGTHLNAFKETLTKSLRQFYKKDYDASDIRSGIIAAVSIRLQDPIFESQTKTKLGSSSMGPEGVSVRTFVYNALDPLLNNFLHKNPDVASTLQSKILQTERERKELQGIKKLARERSKKASLHNKKLRDCRIHFNSKDKERENTMLFITEGDSASGSITTARDAKFQAVFSLKGKPLNTFGLKKKIVYENEEFNLLQNALNIEDDLSGLKYNKVIIATDADVDGMHIRILLLTFFLQFFPDLVRNKHVYILQTPLFRVRNNSTTHYCYSESERDRSIKTLKGRLEVTRFKGLGEITSSEFANLIEKDKIKLDLVTIGSSSIDEVLDFYMNKKQPERTSYILNNLRAIES